MAGFLWGVVPSEHPELGKVNNMISTASELAKHLSEDHQRAKTLLNCAIADLQSVTDTYIEILDRGWGNYEIFGPLVAELTGDAFTYEDRIANPVIEVDTDWQVPLEYSFEDATTACLIEMNVAKSVIESFTQKMLMECVGLIERVGVEPPNTEPIMVNIFGRMATEALEVLEKDEGVEDITEDAIAYEAAHRIAEWVGDTLEAAGESIVLYAVMKMVVDEMTDGA